MRRKRSSETDAESTHGHCADVLMSDFGIPREMRKQVCDEIAKVWVQITMVHCLIIASVRHWRHDPATTELESFLQKHATHPQKHRKPGT